MKRSVICYPAASNKNNGSSGDLKYSIYCVILRFSSLRRTCCTPHSSKLGCLGVYAYLYLKYFKSPEKTSNSRTKRQNKKKKRLSLLVFRPIIVFKLGVVRFWGLGFSKARFQPCENFVKLCCHPPQGLSSMAYPVFFITA